MAIIEVENLVKTYKIIEKEDGLLGYIGENGAEKSTTINDY